MARFRSIKNSFLGGMISRTATGRTDLPQYQHSCELLQNVIPMLSGGVYRRPGTLTCMAIPATTDSPPRLIPFTVSGNQSYAIALGYSTGAGVGYWNASSGGFGFGGNITGNHPYKPTNSSTPNILGTYDDDWWLVQYAQSADIMWLVHPAYKPQVLKRSGSNWEAPTFTFSDFDNGLTGQDLANAYPYLNQNATTATMTLGAGYNVAGTTGVTLTCSTSFFDPKHVGAIFRIDHGTGVVGAIKITGYTSATVVTGTIIIAFSAATAKTEWWESAWSDYRGWPRSVCIYKQRLCMAGTDHQPDSLWFSSAGSYFAFSQLNMPSPPDTILSNGNKITASGAYVRYPDDSSQGDGASTGPVGLQPFRFTLAQSSVSRIQWLSPDQELLIGTLDQEWIISPVNGSFDVANSVGTIQSHYGSDYIPAVRIGYELMFVPKASDEVRAYQYNYVDASFFAEPVQMFFDEYPKAEEGTKVAGRRKFRQIAWDVTRSTLWCVDTCGNLFGMTRDRKLQVTMWHTHQLGGYNKAQGVGVQQGTYADPAWQACDGSVISVAVVPDGSIDTNNIWMVVKRTHASNSQSVFWIERMIGKNITRDSVRSSIEPVIGGEPFYVDGAWGWSDNGDGTKNYTLTVFGSWQVGESLVGTYYSPTWGMFPLATSPVTDAGGGHGTATLIGNLPPDYGTNDTNILILGLPYTSIIKTVRQDAGSVIGTAQGAIKKIARVYVRFFKTLFSKIGSPPGTTATQPYAIPWDNPAQMGQSPELFTGDKKVAPFVSNPDRDQYVYLMQDQPFPWTVVSLVTEGEEYDQ